MSTIEKLFVQIFDRKRQIIEQLKHRKQLYDQHLLSKLLLQGIPPPPWILCADSHPSTSDVTVLNKEELLAGLLLPKPPFASYNTGPCSLYDKPDTAAAESTVPDETCAVNCASSYGVDEEGPGVVPLCHVDSTEAMAGISPPCHVDGSMDTFSYVPMSPEDQTVTRFSNACQLEQSHVSLHRSRSRQRALELRNSAKANAKSFLGMENNVGISPGSKTCRYDEHFDSLRKSLELADPSALSTEPCSNKVVAVEDSLNTERSHDASGRLSDILSKGQDVFDGITASRLTHTNGAMDQRRSPQRMDTNKFSIGSPQMEHMNVTEREQSTPEFEGFIIGESTVNAQNSQGKIVHEDIPFLSNMMDMTSIPDHDSTSASLTTPVSPLPTACKPYFAPVIYSSVPNGLLENNNLQSNFLPSRSALLGKSHSDMFSFPGVHYGWDSKKPFLSPSKNSFESFAAKSAGSDKLGNSDLELTCFPILEDPESGEEDVYDAVNVGVERTESEIQNSTETYPLFDIVQYESSQISEDAVERIAAVSCTRESGNKETICDISVQCESSLPPEDVVERVGLESVTTEVRRTDSSTSGNMEPSCDINMQDESIQALDNTNKRQNLGSVSTKIGNYEMHDNKKSGMGQRSRQTRPGKENKGLSFGANSSKKPSKTFSSRFSKPKLLGQSNLRSSERSVLAKEQKRNNIVSSIKSLLPLVQQKQAAAVVPEKRDLKVKALQAAEAAKRTAEIRENERQQKKEAMKLERVKVEQENLKKLELKKKLKEEQRKKREAENAAKKRQREEEDRKVKERKKRCVEEARLQHKQAEEKLHAWKEQSRCAEKDIRAHQEKDTNEKAEKQFDTENERGESGEPVNDLIVVENDQTEADVGVMSMGSSAIEKVSNFDMAESTTPKVDKIDRPNQTSQSYDLSPYQDSDDEEEEDEMPTKKFVPSWASKSCVASVLLSLQHLDPDAIFIPGSFCSLEEVLLPRRLRQK